MQFNEVALIMDNAADTSLKGIEKGGGQPKLIKIIF